MKLKPAVWSNVFFLIPFFLAFYSDLTYYPLLILITTSFSSLYHYYNTTLLHIVDVINAYILVFFNFYVLYLTGFREPYFAIAMIAVAIAFYFKFTKGDNKEWHIASAIITTLCILAYIL